MVLRERLRKISSGHAGQQTRASESDIPSIMREITNVIKDFVCVDFLTLFVNQSSNSKTNEQR